MLAGAPLQDVQHRSTGDPFVAAGFAYIRETYSVPAELGRRVTVYGRPGVIAADRGHYIGVNFDDAKPGVVANAHPTSEVEYLGMGTLRAPTRSQLRYQRWTKASICFPSFRDFLIHESRENHYPT
ncbi:hypothetical protein [uncultured Variovorax sp.]|uniref:hypothetical protein n=1 Tax=uncultured Variovorax sp. TaxID=114708 RepID=UPI00261742DA|nr:hypothetical protein [uncultured Variovorax sp.]